MDGEGDISAAMGTLNGKLINFARDLSIGTAAGLGVALPGISYNSVIRIGYEASELERMEISSLQLGSV